MDDEVRCFIPGLPDEIALCCLAKVPLCYRLTLRAVCTSWRNGLNEKIFWDSRRKETVFLFQRPNFHGHNAWHCLHPSTKDSVCQWVKLPAMPDKDDLKVKGGSASAVIHGKLFVVGGWCQNLEDGRWVASSTVSYFDMKCYQWKSTASLNIAMAHCAAGVIKDRLYVCGGMTAQGWTGTAEVYNPSCQVWTLIDSIDFSLRVERGSIALNEKFYVTFYAPSSSGRGPKFKGVVYDPDSDEWSDMPKALTAGLHLGTPVILDGKIHVKNPPGPLSRSDEMYTIWIETYDVDNDAWELCDQFVIDEDFDTDGEELLIFEGKLCIVLRFVLDDRVQYVIKDSKNRTVASSQPLFVGPRDAQEKQFVNTRSLYILSFVHFLEIFRLHVTMV